MSEAASDKAVDAAMEKTATKMRGSNVSVFYGEKQALFDVNLDVRKNSVTALIGPSGCGKSTYLRCLNRMNDTIDICKVTGNITLDGEDIYDPKIDVVELRARVGMVFQKPNPFPKSIYENIIYGPRIHGQVTTRAEMDEIVESSLRKAAIWDEVKDRLQEPGTGLSGGQQQRLCIARSPCVFIPRSDLMERALRRSDRSPRPKVEELIDELRRSNYTICSSSPTRCTGSRVCPAHGDVPSGQYCRGMSPTDKFHQSWTRSLTTRTTLHRTLRLMRTYRPASAD